MSPCRRFLFQKSGVEPETVHSWPGVWLCWCWWWGLSCRTSWLVSDSSLCWRCSAGFTVSKCGCFSSSLLSYQFYAPFKSKQPKTLSEVSQPQEMNFGLISPFLTHGVWSGLFLPIFMQTKGAVLTAFLTASSLSSIFAWNKWIPEKRLQKWR